MRLGYGSPSLSRHRRGLVLGAAPPDAAQSSLVFAAGVVDADLTTGLGYTATVRDASGNALVGQTGLTVQPIQVVTLTEVCAQSFVSVDQTTMESDGVDSTVVTVQLGFFYQGDFYPCPDVAAARLVIAVSGTDNTITQIAAATNDSGVATGSFTTTQAATVKTITVTLDGTALTATATCETDGAAPGSGLFFEDDFDGGVRTNSGGFTWTLPANAGVSLVAGGYDGSSHALQFSFGPNAAGVDDSAEQRFNIGQDLDELWIDTRIKFPSNYVHRNESPSNNKMLRLWADDYNDIGKVGASTWYSASAANGSNVRFDRNTGTGIGPSGSPNVPLDLTLDAWTRVRWHWVYPDSVTEIGLVELWFDDVQVGTWAFDGSHIVANPHWNEGYLFGYSNTGFTDETNILLGYVAFHNTDPGW